MLCVSCVIVVDKPLLVLRDSITYGALKQAEKSNFMKYLIIDTETTGLDADRHEMIGFGAIVLYNLQIIESYEIWILPENIEKADSKALEVNGYDPEKWRNRAVSQSKGAERIGFFMSRHVDATLVGHNVQFDIKFLKALSNKQKREIPIRYPYLDTRDLCRAAFMPLGLQSMSLDNICAWLNWRRRKAHTGLSDAEDCAKLIQVLCPPSIPFFMKLRARQRFKNRS